MATITTPAAGVSPYPAAAAAPTVLRASADGTTVLANAAAAAATVSELAAANANTLVVVSGQAALNSLITTSQPGVFEGANVTINLEEQNFNTTNQVTSTINSPSGGVGEIQFNSGSNSFASDAFFTYANSNVVTPGIRTDGYFYSNGAPFTGGGNAAIGNFVFTGDAMSIAHANSTLSVTGNGTGNVNVTANSKTWIFGASGNLTLPANTFAVNYANGTPVVISGAAGLPVANGTSNINIATANGNVTVTANTGNTWTFATGGNLVFPSNLIIDNESPNTRIYQTSGSLKIRATTTASLKMGWDEFTVASANGGLAHVITNGGGSGQPANLVVLTGNSSSTTYQWIFDNQGAISFPNGLNGARSQIYTTNGGYQTVFEAFNTNDGQGSGQKLTLDYDDAKVKIQSQAGTEWEFNQNGILTLPNGAAIRDTASDAVAFGQSAGETSQGAGAVAVGPSAGYTGQGNTAVAIGSGAGLTSQGYGAVAVGGTAGYTGQGGNSVAVGSGAGLTNQGNNSIILNATGAALNQTTANTFTVKPVRGDSTANLVGGGFKAVYYNSSTGEFAYSTD
jgi:hypothetical protein